MDIMDIFVEIFFFSHIPKTLLIQPLSLYYQSREKMSQNTKMEWKEMYSLLGRKLCETITRSGCRVLFEKQQPSISVELTDFPQCESSEGFIGELHHVHH